ncbi:MAG TPA: MFS transporter [Streptosporangiaceae bacterium]|nr:MFS transporter [Streptosporangiaceae bacterium]
MDTFDESAGDNRSKSRAHSPREINGANVTGHSARRPGAWRRRLGPLAERNFRVFYAGYATSLLGTSMSRIALTFAVLDNGGSASELGYVFAANVVPQVFVMLGGGVLADRVGRRPVMLITDTARLAVQGTLAAILFGGRPSIWVFAVLAGLLGTGEGFFNPALGGLRAEIAPPDKLPDANTLLSVAQSAATVAGPALAGITIALSSSAVVIALDAASFGVSVLSLAMLTIPATSPPTQSPWRDLADGWAQFRGQTWLWLTTMQFALFNLFTWAPYLLLGPILARQYLGGAGAWGAIAAAYAGGSVLAGLSLVGRRPRRPLVVAVVGTFGYALPCLLLALRAPLLPVIAAAAAAGCGSAVFGTFWTTVMQQRVAPELLARTTAFTMTGSFALGSLGWTVMGSVAGLVGAGRLLGFAAAYATVSSAAVLATSAIRAVRWQDSTRQ